MLTVYAQSVETAAQAVGSTPASAVGFNFGPLVLMGLIFVVMYIFMILPQQRKQKAHQEKLKQIQKGDDVLTAGGLIVTVTRLVNDHELQVELSEGVKARVLRSMVTEVLPRGGAVVSPQTTTRSASEETSGSKVRKITSARKAVKTPPSES